ncbi:MAG TPA: TIM barrel protein [Caldilineaceae bacterium]|nr:TIM barrel protein [Caldilineaceae bacterium]
MLHFAPNLSMLYTQEQFLDRFARAAAAGFRAVEFLFPYDFTPQQIREQIEAHGLSVVLFNSSPGDFQKGERGYCNHPQRRDEFRRTVVQALEYATYLGVERIHLMTGNRVAGLDRATQLETMLENLAWAAPQAADAGVTLLLEPLNPIDQPYYFVNSTAMGIEIVRSLKHNNVRLQYDVYHAQMSEGNLIQTIRTALPYIGHIQISDVPGRHQPGTGEINYPAIFATLEQIGYQGYIGLEYHPDGNTDASLAWLPAAQRG